MLRKWLRPLLKSLKARVNNQTPAAATLTTSYHLSHLCGERVRFFSISVYHQYTELYIADYTDYVGGGKSVISEAVSSDCWWCEIKMSKAWQWYERWCFCRGWWHWHCQPDKCDRAHTINTSQRHSMESVSINIFYSLYIKNNTSVIINLIHIEEKAEDLYHFSFVEFL